MRIRRPSRRFWTLVASLWALLAGGLLYFSSGTQLITFDRDGELSQRAASMDFDAELINWLQKQQLHTNNTVIHITDPNCPCFAISQPHRDSVQALAKDKGYQNQYLPWSADMSSVIPASPAVIVISQQGQLTYFGPYSSGAFCSADDGLVEPFIKGKVAEMLGAVVVTDAIGCYCAKGKM